MQMLLEHLEIKLLHNYITIKLHCFKRGTLYKSKYIIVRSYGKITLLTSTVLHLNVLASDVEIQLRTFRAPNYGI